MQLYETFFGKKLWAEFLENGVGDEVTIRALRRPPVKNAITTAGLYPVMLKKDIGGSSYALFAHWTKAPSKVTKGYK